MLSQEANMALCRVGPSTPMGELMRRYWQPISPSAELLENPVKKIRILGEDLVLFPEEDDVLAKQLHRCRLTTQLTRQHDRIPIAGSAENGGIVVREARRPAFDTRDLRVA